ncbi:baseplate J/gp47 family protein [Paraburkholderia fungorum]|uniref:baseplate J/gp47 family protein n=1 Tax=Paraburkholderia fungorum TaxID=134537 RepID=UPI0038BA8F94
MTCSGTANCQCGCCAGTSVQTPQRENYLPGLSALSYRVGTWSSFKESMLARLSSTDYPALQALTTRADDDFTVALLDSTAIVLDILTFYQERLANENYLRTAGQLRSLVELSRLIGYQPAPGVAAATWVAFSLTQAPGQPADPDAAAIVIPQGTQVQSVPAQGQQSQTFKTSSDIAAKPDWNALPVQTGVAWTPKASDTSVYLAGTSTQLQPGDLVLFVGSERVNDPTDTKHWSVVSTLTATADTHNNRTLLSWHALDNTNPLPTNSPQLFTFRQRAALFGYNAVSPVLLDQTHLTNLGKYLNKSAQDWNFDLSQSPVNTDLAQHALIDLDAVYPKITLNGWIVLIVPYSESVVSHQAVARKVIKGGFPVVHPLATALSTNLYLYGVAAATTITRADFGMGAKISRVTVDTGLGLADAYPATRSAYALVQSDPLPLAEQPLNGALYGSAVSLEGLRADLVGVQWIAISGTRQKIALKAGVSSPPQFVPLDTTVATRGVQPGEVFSLTDPATLPPLSSTQPGTAGALPDWRAAAGTFNLAVEDSNGRPGSIEHASIADFALVPADRNDPLVSECARIASVDNTSDSAHTWFELETSLTHCYDRATARVNANVGPASQGQSVTELLGSGSAATPNQTFTLKQIPLTFTQAATPTGRVTTLTVQVDGVAWTEVPTLYGQGATRRVYATLNQADGSTDVLFGDGVEGALLSTGQNNVQAKHHVGSGSAGNVAAGTLTTLLDRPLGVSGVTNPQAATGGQNPQTVDEIRACAPQTVLTLGRAVSITDYQNFASTFAGIGKAYAIWIPSGPGRGVFVTAAGIDGAELSAGSNAISDLVTALHDYGNPLIPITVRSYVETLFGLSADLQYDPRYDMKTVRGNVRLALSTAFSFAARSFGQAVSADEVAAVIQGVPGVVAVNVTALRRGGSSTGGDIATRFRRATLLRPGNWLLHSISIARPTTDSLTRLCASLPMASPTALPQAAEIIVLDPTPGAVILGAMS